MKRYRLLVMACSSAKSRRRRPAPPRARYVGPLWQTLKTCDPCENLALLTLSARHGMVYQSQGIEPYDELLTPAKARQMIAGGIRGQWPPPAKDRWTPSALTALAIEHNSRRRPFDEICFVGGSLYLDVMRAFMREAQRALPRYYSRAADITEISGPIGVMRQRLRAWITGDGQASLFD